jgi:hypothetical protein
VKTHRVQFGNTMSRESIQPSSANEIETNEVTFVVEEMSEADEQVIVDRLVNEIRALAEKLMPTVFAVGTGNMKTLTEDQKREIRHEMAHADELGNELSWLTGDPSTRAKVHIFLHPEMFGIFTGSAGKGFEIARNQRLRFLEYEMQREDDPEAVSWSAYLLSQYGPASDKAMIQARLDRCRKKSATRGEKLNPEQGRMEAELMEALIQGKSWQMDETETSMAKESCVSNECRDRAKSLGDLPQTAP